MRFPPRRAVLPVVPILLAAAVRVAAAQAPTTFVSVTTPEYELHATNQALLDVSRAQLDSARAEFARHFPGPVPRLHVVVADTREELQRFDLASLRAQAGEVLAWTIATPRAVSAGSTVMEMAPSARGGAPAGGGEMALFGNLPVAVAPAPDGRGGSVVRFVHPGGTSEPLDLRSGDVVRTLNGTAHPTQQRLLDAYAALPTGATVQLGVEREGTARTVSFTKPAGEQRGVLHAGSPGGAGPRGGAGPQGGATEPRILSHEAGHHLFGAYVRAKAGGRAAASGSTRAATTASNASAPTVAYGTPLPDWLDEGVAILTESPSVRAERRQHVRDNASAAIPLARLFAAEHPALAGLRQMAAARRGADAGPQVGPVSIRVQRGPDDLDARMYYAQAFSVAEFLAERGGPGALATIVDALLAGRSMDEALRATSGVPSSVEALEREWSAWATR